MSDPITDLKELLECPICELEIPRLTFFQNGSRPIRKGDLLVCSGCANILELGDFNLIKASRERLKKLDSGSQKTLAVLTMAALAKIKDESRAQRKN